MDSWMDRPTKRINGLTSLQTDIPTYRDAWTHLKTKRTNRITEILAEETFVTSKTDGDIPDNHDS